MPHKKHVVLALFYEYNGLLGDFQSISPPVKMVKKKLKTMCVMGSWRPPDRHMEQRPTAFDPGFDVSNPEKKTVMEISDHFVVTELHSREGTALRVAYGGGVPQGHPPARVF